MSANHTELLTLAYRTAGRIVRNPVLAEEAAERAVHKLTLITLAGHAPRTPEAWIRTAARRTACELLRSGWSRTLALDDEFEPAAEVREPAHTELRAQLQDTLARQLTRRQQEALSAALTTSTIKDAAAACGMQQRDFRRYLDAISRRARKHLDLPPTKDRPPLRRWHRTPRAG